MTRSTLFRSLVLVGAMMMVSVSAWANSSYLRQQSERAFKLRDPFKQPALADERGQKIRTDLESFALSELKLVGVMTGPDKVRAMIQAPNGKTYFVAEQAKIGTRKGTVLKITDSSIVVKEKIVNVLGDEEDVRIEMGLASTESLSKSGQPGGIADGPSGGPGYQNGDI